MRYIKFTGGTDYCGTDFEEFAIYEDGTSDLIINSDAEDYMESNAQNYEYLAEGDGFETEEDREAYYEGCWCEWEEITEQEYKEYTGEE